MSVISPEFEEALRSGMAALGRYKLRTALSVLGVVLGVAGVVAMVSVAEGAREQTLAQVQALGLDNLVARSRAPSTPGFVRPGLRLKDAESARHLVPSVALLSPLTERRVRLPGKTDSEVTPVLGVGSQFDDILRLRVAEGRFLSEVDERESAAVCVVGAVLATRLAEGRAALGESVRLGTVHCRVVGVLEPTAQVAAGATSSVWRNLNVAALMPLTALTGKPADADPAQRIDEIWLQIDGDDNVDPASQVLAHALRATADGRDDDFDIVVPRQLLEQRQRTHQTFNVVTGSVAALTLLVGGIGIMNVMLMSVVERTYEIGVRRAVGATRGAIRNQFMVEALLMTIAGGTAGIAAGVLMSRVITWYAEWPTSISAASVGVAVAVAFAVGIVFGMYPANTAARLVPLDALRHE